MLFFDFQWTGNENILQRMNRALKSRHRFSVMINGDCICCRRHQLNRFCYKHWESNFSVKLSPSLSLSLFLPFFPSLSFSLYFLCHTPFFSVSLNHSISSPAPFLHPSLYIYQSIYLSINISIYLFIYLNVSLCKYLCPCISRLCIYACVRSILYERWRIL